MENRNEEVQTEREPALTAPREKVISLPLGLMMDGTLVREVELTKLDGWEEDILADTTGSKREQDRKMSLILSRCTKRMGSKVRTKNKNEDPEFFLDEYLDMPIPSRAFAVVRLGQLSHGHEYVFPASCPFCKHYHENLTVDLRDQKVVPASDEFCLQPEHVFEMDDTTIVWRVLTGRDEPRLAEVVRVHKSSLLSALMFCSVVSINGKKPSSPNELKYLSSETRSVFRGELDVGGIDTQVVNTCDNPTCGRDFPTQIPVNDPRFFVRSGRKPRTNTRGS